MRLLTTNIRRWLIAGNTGTLHDITKHFDAELETVRSAMKKMLADGYVEVLERRQMDSGRVGNVYGATAAVVEYQARMDAKLPAPPKPANVKVALKSRSQLEQIWMRIAA